MRPIEKAGYLAHARTKSFHRKVEQAREIIEQWLSRAHKPYVAFSAGKDSTALLHLVRTVDPGVQAIWKNDEWCLPETLELLDLTPHLHRIATRTWHCDWFIAWDGGPEGLPPDTEWVDSTKIKYNTGYWAEKNEYDGVALGLRAEENSYRRIHIRTQGQLFLTQKHRLWQCYPLAWWRVEDIWAYILSHEISYNQAYDRMSELGIPRKQQRVGPFANWRALPFGQLAILREGWPELFERFARRHPEAWSYV